MAENMSHSNIIEHTITYFKEIENEIRGKNSEEPPKSSNKLDENIQNLEQFWMKIHAASAQLSFECTKLCLSFTRPPPPSLPETISMVRAVEKAVLVLASIFFNFPKNNGKVLYDALKNGCLDALQATRTLLKIIQEEGSEGVASRYLQSTGIVWQGCKNLSKVPVDNKAATLFALSLQQKLIDDAFNEISEALKGDGSWEDFGDDDDDEDDGEKEKICWSKEDKDLINSVIYIIKAVRMLFKRVEGAVNVNCVPDSEEKITDLDQIYDDLSPLSKTVDTLVLELYPPVSFDKVEVEVQQLSDLVKTALKTFAKSHISAEDEQKQIEFIYKVVDHNLEKFLSKLHQNK